MRARGVINSELNKTVLIGRQAQYSPGYKRVKLHRRNKNYCFYLG